MKNNDDDLRKKVKKALQWEPILDSNEIDVSVQDAIVTLSGTVDNYTQKNGSRAGGA